ncbi:MAG TPA: UDP-N-acetylglucosamine 2-epimerase (non-hydrolyzing) [Anaerolineaceae bacterium]
MRILTIIGTRPEAVKMAPVVLELQQQPRVENIVCVTAQHRQMLDQVLRVFNISPDLDLNLMIPDQTLAQIASSLFLKVDEVIKSIQPDWILAQGDTTTVMVTSILAYYNRVKFGHIEAGLRTQNKWQPFPEEIHRKICAVTADVHFAPTEYSRMNLIREGICPETIFVTGNPIVDALQKIKREPVPSQVLEWISSWKISPTRKLVFITAHRRENFGKPMENIFHAVKRLANTLGDTIHIIFPVHLNPHVQEPAYQILGNLQNVTLLPPIDYLPLVHLLTHSSLVLTDSGGIQEEATCLEIPTLVLREETERPEGIEAGILRLVGTDEEVIFNESLTILKNSGKFSLRISNPFGDGNAAKRISQILLKGDTCESKK